MDRIFPLEDLPMFWQGRAKALRILDKQRNKSDAITLEVARIYDECANELKAAIKVDRAIGVP